ncbi:glycosyltransferase [Phragmitibacter flavus]|nr:glycosyltransferase [Phragmitibacter flavus]
MRVALVHYSAPPVIGGVERVLGQQAKVLLKHGHEVVVVCANEGAMVEGCEMRVVDWGGGDRRNVGGPTDEMNDDRRDVGGPIGTGRADESSALGFLNVEETIVKHRHVLPHWHQDGVYAFVTWRLADSLPGHVVRGWEMEKEIWLGHHPKPWTEDVEREHHRRFSKRVNEWLDGGSGECLLRRKDCAEVVVGTLRKFDGVRYDLCAFVVMPNHVHVVARLREDFGIEKVVKGWKEWSAKGINAVLGKTGKVWAVGYFDRLVRDGRHLGKVVDYVVGNPARLKGGFVVWVGEGFDDRRNVGGPIEEVTTEDRRNVGGPTEGLTNEGRRDVGGPSGGCRGDVVPTGRADVTSALGDCVVVIVHNMLTMPFDDGAATRLGEMSGECRMINWVHDVDVSREWFEQLGFVGRHVAVSEARKELLRERLGVEECLVVPNGVDVGATLGWSERLEGLKLLEREVVMFHPSRVLARKNMELGILVVEVLRKKRGVDAVYVVSGAPDPHRVASASYAAGLREMVIEKGLGDAVIFVGETGAVSDEEMQALYGLADVVFFPSKAEGFGLPLVEAALFGVPVLCSDIPPHREVAGVDAEFFGLDQSAETVAERVMSMVGARSKGRREAATRYGWDRIYQDYLEPLLKER